MVVVEVTPQEKQAALTARIKDCEAAVNAVLAEHGCRLTVFQRMIDGQLHPLSGLPLVVLPIPEDASQ